MNSEKLYLKVIKNPACRDEDPNLFYGETKGSGGAAIARAAKAVCARCVVQPECLELAMRNKERWGIWGGLTPLERTRADVKRRFI